MNYNLYYKDSGFQYDLHIVYLLMREDGKHRATYFKNRCHQHGIRTFHNLTSLPYAKFKTIWRCSKVRAYILETLEAVYYFTGTGRFKTVIFARRREVPSEKIQKKLETLNRLIRKKCLFKTLQR